VDYKILGEFITKITPFVKINSVNYILNELLKLENISLGDIVEYFHKYGKVELDKIYFVLDDVLPNHIDYYIKQGLRSFSIEKEDIAKY
jgi:hypothetical protein